MGLFEPWVMCDTGGDLIGFEIDVGRRLAADLGVRVRFVRMDWYYILPALVERRFDVIVSGMSITPERALLANFSPPYSEFGTVFVANAALVRGFQQSDYDRPDVTFAVRRDATPEGLVRREFPNARVLSFDTDDGIVEAVLSGIAHAAAVDQLMAGRWLNTHPDDLVRAFEEVFEPLPQGIALRKGDADGLSFLASWVRHYRVNGWFDERWRYWFETDEWHGHAAPDGCAVTFDGVAASRSDTSAAPAHTAESRLRTSLPEDSGR